MTTNNLNSKLDRFLKLRQKLDRLTAANLDRLEHFADSLLEQQQGKRRQRREKRGDRFPVIEDWRIGS